MSNPRYAIEDFQLANSAYVDQQVTFYVAGAGGVATATKATLYGDLTGATVLPNPQTLSSQGAFMQPVYVDIDVIGIIGGTVSAMTGVITTGGQYRGTYLPFTGTPVTYYTRDTIVGPAGETPDVEGNLYWANTIFVSTTWAADLANLTLILDYVGAIANVPFASRAQINSATASKAMGADQFLTSNFDATGKHLIPLGAGALVPDSSTAGGGPSFAANLTATFKVPFRSLDFDAAIQENAGCKVTGPKSADEASAVLAIIRWTANGGTIGQGVVWGLSVTGAGDGDDLDVAYSAAVKVTDALIATVFHEHISVVTAPITVKNWAQNDSLNILVSRFGVDGGDTLTVDAKLTSVDFFLVVNAANDT